MQKKRGLVQIYKAYNVQNYVQKNTIINKKVIMHKHTYQMEYQSIISSEKNIRAYVRKL